VPGVLMDAAGVPGCQVLAVAGRRLEFVINNGGHDWCAAAPLTRAACCGEHAEQCARVGGSGDGTQLGTMVAEWLR